MVTLPAGIYYIGDPMYVLDKEEWHDMVYLSESIYDPDIHFWHHKTMWGDGYYVDNMGNGYGVDSASIGVVHFDVWKHRTMVSMKNFIAQNHTGLLIKFEEKFTCDYEDGIFKIGDIEIDTG